MRREGGRTKVRIVLSAEEVRREVPSGVLEGLLVLGLQLGDGREICHCALLK